MLGRKKQKQELAHAHEDLNEAEKIANDLAARLRRLKIEMKLYQPPGKGEGQTGLDGS